MEPTVLFEPHKTRPLADFYPEMRFEFPDLPDELFAFALIRAARALAKEGKVVRRRSIVHAYPGVTRYSLRSPDGLEVCAILSIRQQSCLGTRYIPRRFDPPATAGCCPSDLAWYDDIEQELRIDAAGCGHLFFLSLAVCPPDNACELPAILYDDYLDLLLLGAKGRILRMSHKPWTDLQLAQVYERSFNAGIQSAAVEVHTHLQRGSIKMNFGRIL